MYTLVRNDDGDWIGLYGPNGKLIQEGHSFESSELLELVGVEHDLIWDVALPEDTDRLPDTLAEAQRLGGMLKRKVIKHP
jgi:hypothetical protein